MRLVVVESPFAGPTPADIDRNMRYARACLADCLRRNEAPIASHLLYTQPGVLVDDVPEERRLGIEAGLAWARHGAASVVYVDLGVSSGMRQGIVHAHGHGRPVEVRRLPEWMLVGAVGAERAAQCRADAARVDAALRSMHTTSAPCAACAGTGRDAMTGAWSSCSACRGVGRIAA